jgi:hypothetical protein
VNFGQLKKLLKSFGQYFSEILPKWQNFAQSGHTTLIFDSD